MSKIIHLTRARKHLVKVLDVKHVIDKNEFKLNAKPINRWDIKFYFYERAKSATYQMPYSPGLFDKYCVFTNAVRRALNVQDIDLYELINKNFYINIVEIYALNPEKKTYEDFYKINEMEYVEM